MMRSLRFRGLLALALLVALASWAMGGPAATGAATPASSLPAGFNDSVVFSGLDAPTAIAFAPDGRVFVAEKPGVIKVYDSVSDPTPTVFADFHRIVYREADRGLLGLAVDPQLGTAGHDYVYALYTLNAPPGGTAPTWHGNCKTPPGLDVDGCVVTGNLVRIAVNADGTAGATKKLIAAQWCQQFSSHSIGHLAFGPDGMLYVSGGEGASFNNADWGQFGGSLQNTPTPVNPCGDPPGGVGVADTAPTARGGALRSQSLRRPAGEPVLLNGALLRVNPATGRGVKSNPAYDAQNPSGNASRIVAYGFRNPFRFTFRPGTSEVWVADVGWNTWEEVDRVRKPTAKPTGNYGWPCYEGANENNPFTGLDLCKSLYADKTAPAIAPYFDYNHSSKVGSGDTCRLIGSSVISAITFDAPNSKYPGEYRGALFFGDHSRSCIWVMTKGSNGLPDPATVKTFVDDSDAPAPVDMETDPASGDIFYVDIDTGSIHRITYTG